MNSLMQYLGSNSRDRFELLWHITPKIHAMMHLPTEARLIGPRIVQCYSEESMVGRATKIWASCKNGKYACSIQEVSLNKYLVILAIELDL